jgi:hypothetical protein
MTAETLDTLRRDMTAAAASLADATRRASNAYDAMLAAALPIADAIAIGGAPSDSAVTAFRIRCESLAVAYDAADLARERFHRAADRFHAAESQNRAAVLADERRLQEGR